MRRLIIGAAVALSIASVPLAYGRAAVVESASVHAATAGDEGAIIFAMADPSTDASDIYLSDGSDVRRLTDYQGPDYSPSWSPDRSQIVFVSDRDDPGNMDLYVMQADGSDARRITISKNIEGGPAWSPDGGSIAFWSSSDDGEWTAWLVAPDGRDLRSLPGSAFNDGMFAWSPDGAGLTLTRNTDGTVRVVALDPATGSVKEELAVDASSPSWSEDGRRLAYLTKDSLVLADPVADTEEVILPFTATSLPLRVDWGPGDVLAYSVAGSNALASDALGAIYIVDTSTGDEQRLELPEGLQLLPGLSW
jgi:Tol biopolymer transport system component